ncbi:flagellar hook capping FlgD N-terminal domain-containing protein [Cereibacter changlensis]|uniref:flagellar hook capping FlgD N-terminal domain-containing protein n=1 Tax=Cereibacter changlensis TaxID=402884 RepID=UPI0040343261
MTIVSATETTATTRRTASSAAPASDYQTFLNMLTTQLRHQDPLNPMEASDFAVQLATFSGVEQQTKTNQLLASLNTAFGMVSMAQLAGWIGNEARVAAPVWVDDAPVTISPEPAFGADRAVLVVKDADGELVLREDVPIAGGMMQWEGRDASGAALPEGVYSLSLESYFGEKLLKTADVEAYGTVIEARGSDAGTLLVLRGGVEVAASRVTGLRAAP